MSFNLHFFLHLLGLLDLFGWKVGLDDGMRRTNLDALSAKRAQFRVDIRQVIVHDHGVFGANVLAFGTSDAGHLAGFLRNSTLVFIEAAYINFKISLVSGTHFNDVPGAGVHAGTT